MIRYSWIKAGQRLRLLGVAAAICLAPAIATAATEQAPAQAQGAEQPTAASVPASLAEMTPRSLVTMPVIGTNDETLGRVEEVMHDEQSGELAFIIKTSDGAQLPLEVQRVEAVDSQLRLTDGLSREEVQQRIERFDPAAFAAAAKDVELAQLSR